MTTSGSLSITAPYRCLLRGSGRGRRRPRGRRTRNFACAGENDNLNNAIEALCGRDASGFSGPPAPGAGAELRRLAREEGTAVLDIAGLDYSSAAELADVRRDSIRIEPVNGSARAGGSSWQSLTRQTGTIEASFLNGEIVLLGRQHDVPTPVNETLQRLANEAARERRPPGSMTAAQVLAAAGVRPA